MFLKFNGRIAESAKGTASNGVNPSLIEIKIKKPKDPIKTIVSIQVRVFIEVLFCLSSSKLKFGNSF
ncbi:hypothetical protein AO058_15285 [Salegentibacter sp. T436]|jgi:hypothetical protein|nr:hypothetical protein AO058_15285 [Salegentibacter sp. T436]